MKRHAETKANGNTSEKVAERQTKDNTKRRTSGNNSLAERKERQK
jgi:hypothetical protein